ncbi:MAG TPA: hypothetical protein ACQGQI_07960 [Xylella sp.]
MQHPQIVTGAALGGDDFSVHARERGAMKLCVTLVVMNWMFTWQIKVIMGVISHLTSTRVPMSTRTHAGMLE